MIFYIPYSAWNIASIKDEVRQILKRLKENSTTDEFFNFDAVIEIEKKKSYNQALEDISEKIKWQYKNYKSMPSIHLFLEIVEQSKK